MSKLFVYGVSGECSKEVLASAFGSCGKVDDVYLLYTGKVWFIDKIDSEVQVTSTKDNYLFVRCGS